MQLIFDLETGGITVVAGGKIILSYRQINDAGLMFFLLSITTEITKTGHTFIK